MIRYFFTFILLIPASVYAAIDDSEWLEDIEIPSCSGDRVKIINDNADWSDINSTSYDVFCVEPGDYRGAGAITITADGTSSQKRYIRWYDSSNPTTVAHAIDQTSPAIVYNMTFTDAHYWQVDGISFVTAGVNMLTTSIRQDSSFNIINRSLFHNQRLNFWNNANNNTLQNSVVRKCELEIGVDHVGIAIGADVGYSGSPNNKILNNELYDCTDQIAVTGEAVQRDHSGTIIDQNDMYFSTDRRSDCNGNPDPDGDCIFGENAIDIKSGGTPGDPVRITNNRMWGMRKSDSTKLGATGSQGAVMAIHMNAEYVAVENNLIFDSRIGVIHWDNNHSVNNNIFYDLESSLIIDSVDTEAYFNQFIDTGKSITVWTVHGDGSDQDILCNTFINAGLFTHTGSTVGVVSDYNWYYNSSRYAKPGSNDIVRSSASEAQHDNYNFYVKRWTGNEARMIPNVVVTDNSPHWQACKNSIGTTTNRGVDDMIRVSKNWAANQQVSELPAPLDTRIISIIR